MPKTQPSAVERRNVLARELGLSASVVHNTLRKLKEAERIAAARPVPPPLVSRDLARMLFGLCASLPVHAPATEQKLGTLPRVSGDGGVNAETELVDLLDEAAGAVGGDINFSTGDILLSGGGHFMMVSGETVDSTVFNRTYRRADEAQGMRRILQIRLSTIKRIAQQLL